jgi:Pyridoxamine 5'-phosphate oxidase
MAAWSELAQSQPDLAAAGERLLAAGEGIAFLATVRADGGPRLHPVVPVLATGGLYLFVVSMSPKHADLLRDGRYALHALPPPYAGEEFYLTGRSRSRDDPDLRRQVSAATGNRLGTQDFEDLFELDISRVLHTRWSGWGTKDIRPHYTRWPGT